MTTKFSGIDGIQKSFSELSVTGGVASVIRNANELYGYFGMSADETAGNIEQHTGAEVDLTGATFATADTGASTQITGVTHGLSDGDYIVINNCSTAGYNGTAQVNAVGGSTDFTIDTNFIDDPTTEGYFQHPDHFEIGSGGAGTYLAIASASGSNATSNAVMEFSLYHNTTLKHKVQRKFSNASDVGAWAISGLITVVEGDEIWLGLENTANTGNADIDEMSFAIHRL